MRVLSAANRKHYIQNSSFLITTNTSNVLIMSAVKRSWLVCELANDALRFAEKIDRWWIIVVKRRGFLRIAAIGKAELTNAIGRRVAAINRVISSRIDAASARADTNDRRLEKYINYAKGGGGGGGLQRRDCKLVRIKVMNINHGGCRDSFPVLSLRSTAAPSSPSRKPAITTTRHRHHHHHHRQRSQLLFPVLQALFLPLSSTTRRIGRPTAPIPFLTLCSRTLLLEFRAPFAVRPAVRGVKVPAHYSPPSEFMSL